MAELAVKRKKIQHYFQVVGVYWWVVVLGLGWWWVDERGKNRETENRDEERRERDFLYYFVV